jgi:hypothetical protein
MKFYKLIKKEGKIELETIPEAYITACDGYTLIHFKEDNMWNTTELITGTTIKQYKTLKEARADVDNMPSKEVFLRSINNYVDYLKSMGVTLPNLEEAQ